MRLPKNTYRVTRVKYLGLIIDWNLRWKIHIEYFVMRLRSITFKLNKPNKHLNTEFYVLNIILYSYIICNALLHYTIQFSNMDY